MLTVEISMMHWQGLTELNPKSYTPLALYERGPARRLVSGRLLIRPSRSSLTRSKPRLPQDEGLRHGPGRHLASSPRRLAQGDGPRGKSCRLGAVERRRARDAGSAAGGLDLCTCSIPEARAIIEAGKARALAIMAPERNLVFKDIPTLKEAMGIDYSTAHGRGIAGPKGLPQDVATKLTATLKKVYDSKEFKDFMSNRGFGTVWATPPSSRSSWTLATPRWATP